MGVLQYAQDFDEYFPCGTGGTISTTMGLGWAGQIFPYVKSNGVFRCPNEKGRPGSTPTGGNVYYSYRYNYSLIREGNGTGYNTFAYMKPIAAYTQTSRSVLLYECSSDAYILTEGENDSPVGNGQRVVSTLVYYPANTIMKPGAGWMGSLDPEPMARHMEGSNVLAADGHVKWFQPEQISYGYHAATSQSAENMATASATAEGTEYSGPNPHSMTMSYR